MKKRAIIFSLFLIFFLLFSKNVNSYYDPGTGGSGGGSGVMSSYEDAVYGTDQYNRESSNFGTLSDFFVGAYQMIVGPENSEYQTKAGKGAIFLVSNLITELYSNPPASSVTYFADVLHNLGIARPAYAQGVGFKGMNNLLPLWKASRNLAYVCFVLVFLYIGLAIMFRVKISPQAVVTIQSALPKLIIGLLLVTFSYAIVGLLIDLIYLLIFLGVLAIGQTGWLSSVAAEQIRFSNLSFGEGIGIIFTGGVKAIWQGILGFMGGGVLVAIVTGLMGTVATALSISVVALPLLILAVTALFCIFKLFFSLIGCYLGIILSLITAPLQIMLGVLPGSQAGFGTWFKNLMANILVFPAVAIFLLLGSLLCGTHGPEWAPPLTGSVEGMIPSLLGFGMLLLLPKIPEMIKNAFKIKPAGYGTAIKEATQIARMPLSGAGDALGDAAKGKSFGVQVVARTVGGILSKAGR